MYETVMIVFLSLFLVQLFYLISFICTIEFSVIKFGYNQEYLINQEIFDLAYVKCFIYYWKL